MNKIELANFISAEHCVTNYDARRAIHMVVDCITKALDDGEKVELTEYKKFLVKYREERRTDSPNIKTQFQFLYPARY